MTVQRFDRQSLPATPWKNGGGITREIACHPPGAGMHDFLWRLSIATIAADGPFSAFPGVDRVITLLDGAGVRLHTADGALDHRLDTPLAPYAFPGEAALQSDTLGGASNDFNVMTRRGAVRAEVHVLDRPENLHATPHGLLLAAAGDWLAIGPEGETPLAPGQGLWWAEQPCAWTLSPDHADARLLAVRILPA